MTNRIEKKMNYWYLPLLFGIISICLGVIVFATPAETFIVLAVFFSYSFMLLGLLEAIYSISNRRHMDNWGWYLALGLLTFIIGIQLVMRPDLSVMMLTFYIGFWLLFRSIMYISSAIDLKRNRSSNWIWVLLFGIFAIIFSCLLLWNPLVTSVAVSIWLGCGLLTLGVIQIFLAFSLKKIKRHLDATVL